MAGEEEDAEDADPEDRVAGERLAADERILLLHAEADVVAEVPVMAAAADSPAAAADEDDEAKGKE